MKLKLINYEGAKTESMEVSDKVFNLKVNHKLIKFVLDWQLNHLKPRTAKTKQRNEVRGSTRKIVPQKEAVVPDMPVEKLPFLLAEVLPMVQREQIIRLKDKQKSEKTRSSTNIIKKKSR